ncbi:MAG: ArnT family glycosyltransferase [Gemmatimonadales bacterium]
MSGRRLAPALAILLTLVGVARIVATYAVYNQTVDEPAHIAAGMQLLDHGTFYYEPKHPPLPRIAVALGPYLAGIRWHHNPRMYDEGNLILEEGGKYVRNLSLARAGTLPFFIFACFIVYAWSRRLFGDPAAVVSVGLFSQLPPILAHSGLATTDMALAATLPAAIYAFTLWLDHPGTRETVILGVALGLAVLSKISAVVFVPASVVAVLAAKWFLERRRPAPGPEPAQSPAWRQGLPRKLAIMAGVCLLVMFAAYRFNVPYPKELGGRIPLPFYEFLKGLYQIFVHAEHGHPGYLFGEKRWTGWWYFFPVTLGIKTPIGFLLLMALAVALLVGLVRRRRNWRLVAPVAAAAVILMISMKSPINNGVRHVLPLYTLMAVVTGFGVVEAWNSARFQTPARAAVAVFALWMTISSARAHPDYLPFFNELAGRHPETIVVDSDLCWGQDYFRLVDTVKARGLKRVWVAYHGSLDRHHHNLPNMGMHTLRQNTPVTGWVAANIRDLKGVRYTGYMWIEQYKPVTRIGESMYLYYIPPGADSIPAAAADSSLSPDSTLSPE